jgi:hypothetical protein
VTDLNTRPVAINRLVSDARAFVSANEGTVRHLRQVTDPVEALGLLSGMADALSAEHYRVDAMHQRAQKAEGRVQKWLAMREVFGSNERAILALEELGAFSIQDLAAQRDEARAALSREN